MQPKEIRFGNAILKVYRPILSQDECEKRKENLSKSLLRFGKAIEREKRDEKKKAI